MCCYQNYVKMNASGEPTADSVFEWAKWRNANSEMGVTAVCCQNDVKTSVLFARNADSVFEWAQRRCVELRIVRRQRPVCVAGCTDSCAQQVCTHTHTHTHTTHKYACQHTRAHTLHTQAFVHTHAHTHPNTSTKSPLGQKGQTNLLLQRLQQKV